MLALLGGTHTVWAIHNVRCKHYDALLSGSATLENESEPAAGVSEVLACHGWTEECLVNKNAQLCRIEMFLASFDTVTCLHLFSNLMTLQLIGQEISSLEPLSCCQHLQHLWLIEASLSSMTGLQHLPNLTHLYLHTNCITVISHLSHLSSLIVLWLAGNRITTIEGLETLTALQELHLADNPIRRIGSGLDCTTSLQVLNLSATGIASLRESWRLAHLDALRELHFADPNWGAAPVAQLANYHTLVLFQLPQLQARHLHRPGSRM